MTNSFAVWIVPQHADLSLCISFIHMAVYFLTLSALVRIHNDGRTVLPMPMVEIYTNLKKVTLQGIICPQSYQTCSHLQSLRSAPFSRRQKNRRKKSMTPLLKLKNKTQVMEEVTSSKLIPHLQWGTQSENIRSMTKFLSVAYKLINLNKE